MDGIFGFFGNQEPTLFKQMHNNLLHRVGNKIQEIHANKISLGYGCCRQLHWQHTAETGIATRGSITLAVCGFFTNAKQQYSPELLITLYQKNGIEALCQLQGSFLIALSDNKDGYLIRDGAGQRTIYYSEQNGRLLFAIEPKGIHQTTGFQRRLNVDSLVQYLSFSFVPGVNTMLENLYELPPGHYLHWKGKLYQSFLHRYYQFERVEKTARSEPEWLKQFQQTFSDCVADRRASQQEVGVFLSGGMDSSVVTAELARQHELKIQSFSLHFGKSYHNELKFAAAVAKRCHTKHHVFEIKPQNFLQRLREIIWYLDDPIGDPITMPNYELASYARDHVEWIFNGEGGDPCFGGPKNYGMMLLHWYGEAKRDTFYQEDAYLKSFKRAYTELDHLFTPEFSAQINRQEQLYSVLTPFFNSEKPAGYLDKLMAMNIRLKGAHLILPKVDRMLGANGFCSLSPLFDERIIELSFAIPSTLKLAGGDEKVIIKRAFKNRLPNRIITRPKVGMRVPVHFWFKNELKSYMRHIFSRNAINRAGIFSYERIQQLMSYDTGEVQPRYGLKLWMLLTFEMWRRRVIENEE